jgi:hypothetical protein
MHNVIRCLCLKTQRVFQGSALDAIFERNWDFKAFQLVIKDIFKRLKIEKEKECKDFCE